MKWNCWKFFIYSILTGIALNIPFAQLWGEENNDLLKQAETALREEKINLAGRLLLQLTRQEPDNQAAFLLLAQVYYAKSDLKKAKKSFEIANPEKIEPAFAFAWGASFYEAGEWRKAIDGFSQSTGIEGLEDYSHYYLGASYFYLRSYFRAQQHLNKARSSRLPKRLRRNKQKLLQLIRKQKEQDLRFVISSDSLTDSTQDISQSPARGTPIPADNNAGAYRFRSPAEEQATDSEQKPLLQISLTPALMLQQASALNENFNFVRNRIDLTAHRESLAVAATRLVEDQRFQLDQTIGLQVFIGNADYEAKISDERIISLDETTGGFIEKNEIKISEGQGFFGVEPFAKIPLSSTLTLMSQLLHHEVLPEYNNKNRWGLSLASLKLQFQNGSFSLFTGGTFTNQFDQEEDFEFQDNIISAGVGYDLEDFRLELSASFLQTAGKHFQTANPYRYVIADPRMRVPDGYRGYHFFRAHTYLHVPIGNLNLNLQRKNRLLYKDDRLQRLRPTDSIELAVLNISQLALRYGLPILTGITLIAEGFYHLYGDYFFAEAGDAVTNSQQVYQLNVTQIGYQLGVSVAPIDWLRFHAHFESHTNRYDEEAKLDESFKVQNPNFGSTTHFLLELSKDF